MRYATIDPSSAGQARSRRIGRCARCHASVLSDEEFYGHGAAIVHGACGAQPPGPTDEPRTPMAAARPRVQQARRMRRMIATTGLAGPVSIDKP